MNRRTNPFDEIIDRALREAEEVPCSRAKYYRGLLDILDRVREHVEMVHDELEGAGVDVADDEDGAEEAKP